MKENKKRYQFVLKPSVSHYLERLAKRMKDSRSGVIETLILEEMVRAKKFGRSKLF